MGIMSLKNTVGVIIFQFVNKVTQLESTGGTNTEGGNNSTNVQPTFQTTNKHQVQTIPNSYQQNQNNPAVINPANRVTNFSGNSYKNILLQTSNADVVNLDQRNSKKCNILFDSGAQLSYIER